MNPNSDCLPNSDRLSADERIGENLCFSDITAMIGTSAIGPYKVLRLPITEIVFA